MKSLHSLQTPLRGVRVLELAGLAPVPMTGLMLQHAGASILRVDRCSASLPDVLGAGKRSVAVNTKCADGLAIIRRLISETDILLDPFRPGTLDGIGLDAENLQSINPRLIMARITGYGSEGPISQVAGHDINYLAASGILSLLCKPGQQPQVKGSLAPQRT
jgi:alpha-methylacyl-CoA racemase